MASLTKLTAAPVSSSMVPGVPLISTGILKVSGTDCDTECIRTIISVGDSYCVNTGSFNCSSVMLCTDWLLSAFCLMVQGLISVP